MTDYIDKIFTFLLFSLLFIGPFVAGLIIGFQTGRLVEREKR